MTQLGDASRAQAVEATARRVLRAIDDEGPEPRYHRRIRNKHRHEWPTLWAAIDKLREALEQ